MQEFRVLGWSDRAAACLSVEKTGGVITAAGLIMSVSFLGLLIPKTVVLNQYGFTLFVGVGGFLSTAYLAHHAQPLTKPNRNQPAHALIHQPSQRSTPS